MFKERRLGKGTIGFDESAPFYQQRRLTELFSDVTFKSAAEVFNMVRIIKTEEEIKRLRRAAQVAGKDMMATNDKIREGVTAIGGSSHKARIRFDKKLKFPGKNDGGCERLDSMIIEAGQWLKVSVLDTATLAHIVEEGSWNKELIDEV